jgi:hypothetical protein
MKKGLVNSYLAILAITIVGSLATFAIVRISFDDALIASFGITEDAYALLYEDQ